LQVWRPARIASTRGHDVHLFERSDELGGNLIPASVSIHLRTEVTSSFIEEATTEYDVVIVATGSEPIIPNIKGLKKEEVVSCIELLLGKKEVGDRVLIIGGGLVGCETALWLSISKGCQEITVVEKLPELLYSGVEWSNRWMLLDMLKAKGVNMLSNTCVMEVKSGTALLRTGSEYGEVKYDTLIAAVGMKPRTNLYKSLQGKISELYVIGDCKEPRKIHDANGKGSLSLRTYITANDFFLSTSVLVGITELNCIISLRIVKGP